MSTEWLARRSKDRLLCGRKHPLTGEYMCQGEIASLLHASGGVMRAGLRGFVEVPAGSSWWEPSRTAREKMARGQRPSFKVRPTNAAGERVRPMQVPDYPWRRACPECKCTALVDSGVLG